MRWALEDRPRSRCCIEASPPPPPPPPPPGGACGAFPSSSPPPPSPRRRLPPPPRPRSTDFDSHSSHPLPPKPYRVESRDLARLVQRKNLSGISSPPSASGRRGSSSDTKVALLACRCHPLPRPTSSRNRYVSVKSTAPFERRERAAALQHKPRNKNGKRSALLLGTQNVDIFTYSHIHY